MEDKLLQFSDWLHETYRIKATIKDKKEGTSYGQFNILISKGGFEISNHDDISQDSHEEIYDNMYHKLDELNIFKNIIGTTLPFTKNTTHLLNTAKNLYRIKLHNNVCNVDLSTFNNITDITFSLKENTSIIFPKSIISCDIIINTTSCDLSSSIVSLFKIKNLKRATFSLGENCNELDLNKLDLSKLDTLGVIASSQSSVYYSKGLDRLTGIDIYGSMDGGTLNIDFTLPKSLKNILAFDCNFSNDDAFKLCYSLEDLALLDVKLNSRVFEQLLTNHSIPRIQLSRYDFKNFNLNEWNLSQTISLGITNTKLNNIDFIKPHHIIENLKLDSCQIEKVPHSLPDSIISLSFYNNNITTLPETFPNSLSFANFDECKIVNIPKSYLSKFSIRTKPSDRYSPKNPENTLSIANNLVENPPLEILQGTKDNIQSYIDSMIGNTSTLNEAKIIFVGDGAVGKTSLMKRLVHDEFDAKESQTDGIEIEPYKVDLGEEGVVNATIWDFGGQQILQATHQLFLSKRSIYVLVVEDRKNDKHKDQDIEQWLTQINSLGGRPPILVVKNKVDENPNSDIQTQKLKTKFPNIVGFFEVSCEKRMGLERLDTALTECVRTLTMRKIALPNNWLNVKKQLKEQACSYDLLYLNTYKEICETNGIDDRFAKDTLLRLLHDLGAVIAFEELKSHNTAILNPHWITEGIYAIIRSEALAENNGVITLEGVQDALDSYSEHNRFEDKASYILDAMRNFELCHITEETNTYLIPALLPPQINLETAWNESIHEERITFLFRFEHLMPPPLIPMFLVKMHGHILGEQRWRSGAIISPSHLDARALVDADAVAREIKLTIMGEERRDLLILLRAEINGLSSRLADINEIGLQELIALDDSGETIGYDELIGLKRMGKNDFPVGKLNKMFSVSQLLGEIEPPADTEKALKTLMESSGNGLINLHMTQKNENIATGGAATNHVTANNTNTNNNTATATATAEVKQDFRALKGQAEFVLEDIRYEIEGLTSSDRQLKDYATKECDKVERAINELEKNVDSQETADENLRHFSRIQNFLEGALKKTNSVGKVIDKAGDVYNEVGKLATKFNSIAEKFGIPTTVVLTGLGLG